MLDNLFPGVSVNVRVVVVVIFPENNIVDKSN